MLVEWEKVIANREIVSIYFDKDNIRDKLAFISRWGLKDNGSCRDISWAIGRVEESESLEEEEKEEA